VEGTRCAEGPARRLLRRLALDALSELCVADRAMLEAFASSPQTGRRMCSVRAMRRHSRVPSSPVALRLAAPGVTKTPARQRLFADASRSEALFRTLEHRHGLRTRFDAPELAHGACLARLAWCREQHHHVAIGALEPADGNQGSVEQCAVAERHATLALAYTAYAAAPLRCGRRVSQRQPRQAWRRPTRRAPSAALPAKPSRRMRDAGAVPGAPWYARSLHRT